MNYSECRRKIRSGDLLAWSHRGLRSWHDLEIAFVRLATRSEYSHVGIAWVTGGRVFVIDAVNPAVRIHPLSSLLPCFWMACKPMSSAAENFALATVGQPYSKWQAIRAFFGDLKIGTDGRWQCAEHVIKCMWANGVDLACRATPSEVVRTLHERTGNGIFPLAQEDHNA